ncbi:MAG TPA: helix-turn-helix domain-containing protein [Terriglobales bacterium]|nr:helix-turn-helix domain-containing protein [Terriglobales bacterium]
MNELLTTVDVGRLAGVGPTAVKRWADQGILPCVRTAGGHRRFHTAEVEKFLLTARRSGASAFVDLLLQADGLGVEARLLTERSRLGSWLAVAEMLGVALAEIGTRWRAGSVSVVQEHLASERLGRALARISEALPVAPGAPRCMLACAEGDRHALGLSLVELALREAGWLTLWAGQDTPSADLAEVARRRDVEMIAVSASAVSVEPEALRRQVEVLGTACENSGVALALGGSGAWPESLSGAERFRELAPFVAHARDLASSRHVD